MGRGSGRSAAMSGPLAHTIPANRDVTRDELGRPGATLKLEGAPPRCVGGNCGWAGRAGEPLLGARGHADATIMCERCRVASQQIVGAARGGSSSELIRLSDAPP
jgi:hypothetical protein